MDSFPSLIPIKLVLKVSEEELKTKLESHQKIRGKPVKINEVPDLECRIKLQLYKKSVEKGEEVEIIKTGLTLLNIGVDMEICSNFAFYIKSANFLAFGDAVYAADARSWGTDACNFADLFDTEKKFIVDGELTVEMKGIIFVRNEINEYNKPKNCLTERLWMNEEDRDFTIVVCKEDECKTEIKIHKCVLAVHSPVFQRMFQTDMKEKQEGKVQINDFDLDTVRSAVAFCYEQDIFEDYRDRLINLLQFADKYDIEDLKKQTELFVVEEISLENICEVTNAVISLNAPKLQEFCFRFLLMALREGIPFKDMEILDKEFANDLMKKAASIEYC